MAGTEAGPEAIVALYYERVDAADVVGVLELFDLDAVYRRPGYPPIQGRPALDDFYRNQRVIKSGRHTITKLISHGADVAVQGTFGGTLTDGSVTQLEFADFYSLRNGVFTKRTTYFYAPLV